MPRKQTRQDEKVRIVTSNTFITAYGIEKLSLKARKLLYLAISQCRKNDRKFYEFSITVKEFSKLIGINPTHVYQEVRKICTELTMICINTEPETSRNFCLYTVFSYCQYRDGVGIVFKLNSDMMDFLLKLRRDFSQPLLNDFVKMRSPYSMAIWHLMQEKMGSEKPNLTEKKEFELTVAKLRQITGAEDKLKQIGQFKERILDKAIREIKENCAVKITYTDIKTGRTITAFHFKAVNQYHIDKNRIKPETMAKVANHKRKILQEEAITISKPKTDDNLKGQIELEDYLDDNY